MSDSYDAISRAYDALWGPISARRYLPAVAGWLEKAVPFGSEVVDLACGTGQVAAALCARGYRVAGVDLSAGMIDRARANAPFADLNVASFERLPFTNCRFSAALCLFDSLNHADPGALPAVLAEVARVLQPGGLLIFDLNTDEGFRERWRGSSVNVGDDLVCVTRARFDADRRVGEYLVTVFEPSVGGAWSRADAVLSEHVHSPSDVQRELAGSGFMHVEVSDSERDLGVAGDTGRDFYRAYLRDFVAL